jgi:lipoprotein-anchoring transpeptidase ErfK/SrfK
MAAGDPAAANSYDLPGIPWVSYLTEKGISFHGTYWHNDYGKPRSHGCINLTPDDARWIYRWSNPAARIDEETITAKTGTKVAVI